MLSPGIFTETIACVTGHADGQIRRGFHTQLRVRRCEADSQNPEGLILSHPRHTYLSMSASSHSIGEHGPIRTRVHFDVDLKRSPSRSTWLF